MNREEFLKTVRKQIYYIFDRASVEQELSQHLDDSIEDLIADGHEREEAEQIAIKQMGNPKEIGKMLNEEHHPVLGYLYLISSIFLGILLIPALYALLFGGAMLIRTSTPVVVENSVEVYPLDIDVRLSTHRLKLDNICIDENGQNYITFREWVNWDYSRTIRRMSPFWIINENQLYNKGDLVYSSGFGLGEGYMEFDWPEDGILRMRNVDGKQMELNLEEYCNE